jgi:hypothetical protein
MHRSVRAALVLLAVASPLAACGDDESTDDAATDDTETTASDTDTTDATDGTDGTETTDGTDGEGSGECAEPGLEGEVSRTADGEHVEASITGDDVVDAVAYSYAPGTYTIYVADHELDRGVFEEYDVGNFSTDNAISADEGGVVASIFVTTTGDAAGTEITLDGSTPSPIIDSGGGASASTMNPSGTITVIAADDQQICFDIDYSDDFQTIAGTVSAEVWQGS